MKRIACVLLMYLTCTISMYGCAGQNKALMCASAKVGLDTAQSAIAQPDLCPAQWAYWLKWATGALSVAQQAECGDMAEAQPQNEE